MICLKENENTLPWRKCWKRETIYEIRPVVRKILFKILSLLLFKILSDFASRTTTKLEIFAKRNKNGDKRDIRMVLETEIFSPCERGLDYKSLISE